MEQQQQQQQSATVSSGGVNTGPGIYDPGFVAPVVGGPVGHSAVVGGSQQQSQQQSAAVASGHVNGGPAVGPIGGPILDPGFGAAAPVVGGVSHAAHAVGMQQQVSHV